MIIINSKELLCDHVNRGNQVKYIYFWGHQKNGTHITKSCFSQWYDAPFEIAGVTYNTAEHYMMAHKARIFSDFGMEEKIIAANSPAEAKKLGRQVNGFDEQVWIKHRSSIVVEANIAKFSQHPQLKEFLLNTKNRILVEASPVDRIWGIGLAADDPAAEDPNLWKGLNLLGFALMEVRAHLSKCDQGS